MADKFKIFIGTKDEVERDFNQFLKNLDGTYTSITLAGDKDNLILGVAYNDTFNKAVRTYF